MGFGVGQDGGLIHEGGGFGALLSEQHGAHLPGGRNLYSELGRPEPDLQSARPRDTEMRS
jgi:hypothetical protein